MLKKIWRLRHLLVLFAFTTLLVASCKERQSVEKPSVSAQSTMLQSGDLAAHRVIHEDGKFNILVSKGSEEQAIQYLKDIKGEPHLRSFEGNFVDPDGKPASDLDALLHYIGQGEVSARQLEQLPSATLGTMGYQATRFFAPKIVDVSANSGRLYGWRKVVRLEIREGSGAKTDGMKALWVLFNYLDKSTNFPPLTQDAVAVQAILERRVDQRGTPNEALPVYFFVYAPFTKKYEIGLFLSGSFDAGVGPPEDKYYLPHACAECHGSAKNDIGLTKSKINYLDTDHWFDRVQQNDDFPEVPSANVLPDGGAPGPSFDAAFGVIRSLNSAIQEQNRAVGGDGDDNFQLRAVTKWSELHKSDSSHKEPFSRSLGESGWQADKMPDKELLPMLNQYCFRCHSSLKYHVFDKQAVVRLKGAIKYFVGASGPEKMPQDRTLDVGTKERFLNLIDQL